MSKQQIKDGAATTAKTIKGLVELVVTFADLAAAYVLLTQDHNVVLMVVGTVLAAHGIVLAANKFTK